MLKVIIYNTACCHQPQIIDNINILLEEDADVICLSRFNLRHIDSVKLRGYQREFIASMPDGRGDPQIGIMTLYRSRCDVTHLYFDHVYETTDVDQGNVMSVINTGNHRLLHCLPCFGAWPPDKNSLSWQAAFAHTQQIFDIAAAADSIIIGNMHIESHEKKFWDHIDLHDYENVSEMYNTYKSQNGTCLNMQQVWRRHAEICNMRFPVSPILIRDESTVPYHIPLMFEVLDR